MPPTRLSTSSRRSPTPIIAEQHGHHDGQHDCHRSECARETDGGVAERPDDQRPGRIIDIHNRSMSGNRPATVEPIEVLGTNGLFGLDGYTVEFSLPCGAYAVVAYGVSSDAFKAFIAGLVMND